MVPAALSLLVILFRRPQELGAAFGVWGAVSGAAGAVGVLLGGTLTAQFGWKWIFFINIPIVVLAALVAPVLLPEARLRTDRAGFDPFGAITVTGGVALLIYALVETERVGWASVQTLSLLGFAVVLLVIFVIIESRVRYPLVRLGLLRLPQVANANLAAMLFGGSVLVPLFYFATLYLQVVLGYPAQAAGFALTRAPSTPAAS